VTDWPVVRRVRKLPSGRVEYTLVDEHGNVRRYTCSDRVGAFLDTQTLLHHVTRDGIRPKGGVRWRDD